MRFLIQPDGYTVKPPKDGVIPMQTGGYALFLKETAAPLLETAGQWTEFSAFAQRFSPELQQDMRDGLTLLDCFGLAELDRTDEQPGPCRVAGERDYRTISAFLTRHMGKGANQGIAFPAEYCSEDSVRARQFNNKEYNFLFERGGEPEAVLVVGVPAAEDVSNAATIQLVTFSSEMAQSECMLRLRALLHYAEQAFLGDCTKFRFRYISPAQDHLLGMLCECGFAKVCTLERELYGRVDVALYDKMIGGDSDGAC